MAVDNDHNPEEVACQACGGSVLASHNRVLAFGLYWHEEHWACNTCGTSIHKGDEFFQHAADDADAHTPPRPQCGQCCTALVGNCVACTKPLRGRVISFNNKSMHRECFQCSRCQAPLTEGNKLTASRTGHPVCEKCTTSSADHRSPGDCTRCKVPIAATDKFARSALGLFHQDCWACVQCDRKFVFEDTRVYTKDGSNPLCQGCISRA
eukprot:m.235616 g.235616  ORF g.235616 m.235616 type:complete len:209 (+) comp18927_c0_seq11:481-1107(+)